MIELQLAGQRLYKNSLSCPDHCLHQVVITGNWLINVAINVKHKKQATKLQCQFLVTFSLSPHHSLFQILERISKSGYGHVIDHINEQAVPSAELGKTLRISSKKYWR